MNSPIFNIHDIVLILTLVVCLLLALFQGALSKQKTIANIFLASFFVCVGMGALANLLVWNIYLPEGSAVAKELLVVFIVSAMVGKGIFLFLYVLSSTRKDFNIRQTLIWAVPVAVIPISYVLILDLSSDQLRFNPSVITASSIAYTNILWHFLKIAPIAFALLSVRAVLQYRQELKSFYSEWVVGGPRGLLLMMTGFLFCWTWSFGVHVLGIYSGVQLADFFGIFDNYLNFILVNGLFIYGIIYAHQLLETKVVSEDKTKELIVEPSQDVISKIRSAMEVDKLYLKQNINVEELAKHIGIHYRELSSAINNHFDTNFFEFVNGYRVEHAKAMLISKAYEHLNIMDIFLESGFNSKSAFNRFFKRNVGVTAAEYRKQHSENS